MSWQLSPLPTLEISRLATLIRSARKAPRVPPFNTRDVVPILSCRAAQARHETSTQHVHSSLKTRHGQHLRNSALPKSLATAPCEQGKPVRCVQLLETDHDESHQDKANSLVDQRVRVSGTIKAIRKQKHGAFVHLSDGSCFEPIQVVLNPELAVPLNNGTNLQILGIWKSSPARGQAYELVADKIHIFGTTDIERYPIQKKYQTPEFLRTIPHLRVRTPLNLVLARFRSNCLAALNEYFSASDYGGGCFVQVQPPVITSSDCEGAGEVFTLLPNAQSSTSEQAEGQAATSDLASFFKAPKYLTVSSQLHLEAYASALQNVWALSPTFRAEKSDTPRHLAEFYMLEVELGYATSLCALTDLVEHLIRSLVRNPRVEKQRRDLFLALHTSQGIHSQHKAEEVAKRWDALSGAAWKHLSYIYCMRKLRQAAEADRRLFDHQPIFGASLHVEHERWIVEKLGNNRPVFVTHYPKAIKPFYMAPSHLAEDISHDLQDDNSGKLAQDPDPSTATDVDTEIEKRPTVACFDLLLPFGANEVAGGSLREHRLEHLIQNMRQNGMLQPKHHHHQITTITKKTSNPTPTPEPYPFLLNDDHQPESLGSLKWYADLRRHATTPHGGFGIGWDRLLAYLTGIDNLREMVPFPRSYGRADC